MHFSKMKKRNMLLLAFILIAVSSAPAMLAQAQPVTAPYIRVHRTTIIYPNYAMATDTITVVNGSISSLIARFPTGVIVLNASGGDVAYAYQISTNPSNELVAFSDPLTPGMTTNITYLYSGFVSAGTATIPFGPSYSTAAVGNSASFRYGLPGLGPGILTLSDNLNVTQGENLLLNYTPAFAGVSATALLKPQYQAYISSLIRSISYTDGALAVQDQLTVTWTSPSGGSQIYLLLPSSVKAGSIKVSDQFGNVTSYVESAVYPNSSVLIVNARYQMQQGNSYSFMLSYSVDTKEPTLSEVGFLGMYIRTGLIRLVGLKPLSGSWQSSSGVYYTQIVNYIPGVSMPLDYQLVAVYYASATVLGSFVVLIVGAIALISAYGYARMRSRPKKKIIANTKLRQTLDDAYSSIHGLAENVERLVTGESKSVSSSAFTSASEMERRLSKELSDAVGRGELDRVVANELLTQYRSARSALSDLLDLHNQFIRRKVRETVYLEIKEKYRKTYSKALSGFKERISNL